MQVVAVLALGAASGLAYNSMRPEGQVDLDRQYFGAKVNAQRAAQGDPRTTSSSSTTAKDPAATGAGETIPPAGANTPEVGTTPDATSKPPIETTDGGTEPPANGGSENASSESTPPVDPPPPPADGLQRMALIDAQDMVGQEGIAVFVDARKRADYDAGHIPGAVYLSHYESSNLIDDLRPTLEQAFFIIVYCNGGQCEDSKSLAFDLISVYGFAHENVYVFEGGMEEWTQAGLTVEKSE